MKKFALLLTVIATLSGTGAYAQTPATGKAAASAKNTANNGFAWGIGIAAVAVVGTVVGIAAASSSSTPSSHSH